MKWAYALIVTAAAGTLPAAAAEDPVRRQMESMLLCRNIAEPQARLACFDKAALPAAEAMRTPPPLDEQQVAERREDGVSLFGLQLWGGDPKGPQTEADFGRQDVPQENRVSAVDPRTEVDEITMLVAEYASTPADNVIFVLENGQIWRTLEPMAVRWPDRDNKRVRIREGAFGNYLLQIAGLNKSYGVRRLK